MNKMCLKDIEKKLGFVSYILAPKEGWMGSIKYAIENGFSVIELVYEYPQTPTDDELKICKELIKTYNLTVDIHGPLIGNDLGCFKKEIRNLSISSIKKCIDVAEYIGAQYVTIHLGHMSFSDAKSCITLGQRKMQAEIIPKTRKLAKKSIMELIKFAKNKGVSLNVENQDSKQAYIKSIDDFDFFSEVEDINFTLDVGHAFVSDMDYILCLEKYHDKISVIHLNDNNGEIDEHLVLGQGKVDFKTLFKTIEKVGFEGLLIIETLPGMYDSIFPSRDFLRETINKI